MNDIKKILLGFALAVLIFLLLMSTVGAYGFLKFRSNDLEWGKTRIYAMDDEPSWPFSYLAIMKHQNKEYPDEQGISHIVPQRLVFISHDELNSPYSFGTIKFGSGTVTIPNDDLTMDLQVPELQDCFQQLCIEYSTSSKDYSKAEIHFAAIPQQNGDMIYVMAKLIDNYATRSVWTVNQDGTPTPIAFNWTTDRSGYKYRPDFTRQEILFNDLYLPSKN